MSGRSGRMVQGDGRAVPRRCEPRVRLKLPENAAGRRRLLNPVPIMSDRANHKVNPTRSPITPGSALHLYRTCAMTTFYTYPELIPSPVALKRSSNSSWSVSLMNPGSFFCSHFRRPGPFSLSFSIWWNTKAPTRIFRRVSLARSFLATRALRAFRRASMSDPKSSRRESDVSGSPFPVRTPEYGAPAGERLCKRDFSRRGRKCARRGIQRQHCCPATAPGSSCRR